MLFIVPGNHDLERDRFKYLPAPLLKPFKDNNQVNEWLLDEEGIERLLQPFKDYSKFAENYFGSIQKAYAYMRKFKVGGKHIALLGLNSALISGRNKIYRDGKEEIFDRGFLVVGEPQIYNSISPEWWLRSASR